MPPSQKLVVGQIKDGLEDYKGLILVSQEKLDCFQCSKFLGKWSAEKIGKKHAMFLSQNRNFHFISESLDFDNVVFFNDIIPEE